MNTKRPRGRPRGTGIDDAPDLRAIADLVLADPALTPTAAMRQRYEEIGGPTHYTEAVVRRWQEKWRTHKHQLLKVAEARRAPARPVAARPSAFDAPFGGPSNAGFLMRDFFGTPEQQADFKRRAAGANSVIEDFLGTPEQREALKRRTAAAGAFMQEFMGTPEKRAAFERDAAAARSVFNAVMGTPEKRTALQAQMSAAEQMAQAVYGGDPASRRSR